MAKKSTIYNYLIYIFCFSFKVNTTWLPNLFIFLQNGADDVKRHRWFKGLDWDEVFYRKLKVITNLKNLKLEKKNYF